MCQRTITRCLYKNLITPARHIIKSFAVTLTTLRLCSQRSFAAAVGLYDEGDHRGAIALFEEALVQYYEADSECRALCQWPQRFDGHDHLRYRYSLYEIISGRSRHLGPLYMNGNVFIFHIVIIIGMINYFYCKLVTRTATFRFRFWF